MTAFGFNILDIVFVSIVGIFAIRGLLNGMLEEGAALLGLALGFVLANHCLNDVIRLLSAYVSSPQVALIMAYVMIFVAAIIAALMVCRVLRKILLVSAVKWLDYMGGALLGAAKGIVVCLLIYMGFNFISPSSEVLADSVIAPHLGDLLAKIIEIFPNLNPDSITSLWPSIDLGDMHRHSL